MCAARALPSLTDIDIAFAQAGHQLTTDLQTNVHLITPLTTLTEKDAKTELVKAAAQQVLRLLQREQTAAATATKLKDAPAVSLDKKKAE